MEPMGKTPAIASKLNTLLRMGLVSKNNVRRAMTLFADPEKALKNPAYRLLMQEILVDVVDRVVNNKSLYATMRASLSKEPATVIEGVEGERTKTLLRSGLVKKKDVLAARRALESPQKAKSMGASKVYRDMMITMLDSMVKKITGSPVLFNAFKSTLGKETVEESFEVPTTEGMDMFWLCEDAQALMEKNKPTKPELWSRAKAKARAKFDVYPSAYANGWAVKWYNEQGGGWKSVSEGKTFWQFSDELSEANWEGSPAQAKLKKAKSDYDKHAAEIKKPVPPARGSTHPMARQDTKSGKMYWAADRRKKSGTGTKRASDVDYRMDGMSEGKTLWQFSDELSENNIEEGSAVPSRKESLAAIKWGKQALKNPAKHNISREDILANTKVARDTLRPIGSKGKKVSKMSEGIVVQATMAAAAAAMKKREQDRARAAAEQKKKDSRK